MNWKILGIVLLVLFIIENLLLGWGVYLTVEEERQTNNCYYNYCQNSYDADYSDGVCTCYDLDMYGDYTITKQRYLG